MNVHIVAHDLPTNIFAQSGRSFGGEFFWQPCKLGGTSAQGAIEGEAEGAPDRDEDE